MKFHKPWGPEGWVVQGLKAPPPPHRPNLAGLKPGLGHWLQRTQGVGLKVSSASLLTGWGELSFCWGCLSGACLWLWEQSPGREGRRREWGIEGRVEWGPRGCCLGNSRLHPRLHPPEGREFDLRGWETRNLLVCWCPRWQGQFRSDQNKLCGSGS